MYALIDNQSILVTEGGDSVLIAACDPTYGPVRRYLVDERGEDFHAVRGMVERFRNGVKETTAQAVSVVDGNDGDDGEAPYRLVHGDPVEEVILAAAIRLTNSDSSMAPLGEFLRRLERNPSSASRSQLFGWLKAGGFTLTTDGFIVGYKSVRSDGLSAHSGREPVTVEGQDGSARTVVGRVPYPVGATVWMPRDTVDDDRHSECSVGIHVGTLSYASTFSDETLVVLVDPADVVAVPADHQAQKMRVCRLYVAARYDGVQVTDEVVAHIRTMPDFDASEDYANRPENSRRLMFGVSSTLDMSEDNMSEDKDDDSVDGGGEGVM